MVRYRFPLRALGNVRFIPLSPIPFLCMFASQGGDRSDGAVQLNLWNAID